MLRFKPVRLLVKVPVPVPSSVLLSDVVGDCDVLQQTPFAVIDAPPSSVTFPPEDAVVWAIAVTLLVDTEGRVGSFSQDVRYIIELIVRITITGILNMCFMTAGVRFKASYYQ